MYTPKFLALFLVAIAAAGPALAAPLDTDGSHQSAQSFDVPSAELEYPSLASREDVVHQLLARQEMADSGLVRRAGASTISSAFSAIPGAARARSSAQASQRDSRLDREAEARSLEVQRAAAREDQANQREKYEREAKARGKQEEYRGLVKSTLDG